MSKVKSTRISGTREWSVASVNCATGCEHNCRYCYARANALRFGRIASADDWARLLVRPSEVKKQRRKCDGKVMFPTTHDITPSILPACLETVQHILEAGNQLLIVSKPHLQCIREICSKFAAYREEILFRFTIGAVENSILGYWEPGAPTFEERKACLIHAHAHGFATSVSAEPLLDAIHVEELVRTLKPYVTDSIWIGKLNHLRSRVLPGTRAEEIARIEAGQTDEAIQKVYALLKDHPLIKWKESYKEVLGLDLATVSGLDL